MDESHQIIKQLEQLASPKIAEHSKRFFKTGKGEYGEGDEFYGIRVPELRKLVKRVFHVDIDTVLALLYHDYHETRLLAVLILVTKYERSKTNEEKQSIAELYVTHAKQVNNWDLVDSSCHKILGPHLFRTNAKLLYEFVESDSIWLRRIAIITTYYFIKRDEFTHALSLAEKLLLDKQDLIHKAVGWMLRELGKRNQKIELQFLDQHYQQMPRTMLRYAIEKLPEEQRQNYLKEKSNVKCRQKKNYFLL